MSSMTLRAPRGALTIPVGSASPLAGPVEKSIDEVGDTVAVVGDEVGPSE